MRRHSVVYGFTPGRSDVFWCALDNASLMHSWGGSAGWRTETIANGDHPYEPAAAVYVDQPGKMDVGWIERPEKIKYMQFNGGQWSAPAQLNPSSMTPAPGSGAPVDFHLGSPLVACPNAVNRRSPNTEFFVRDNSSHIWGLTLSGTTWTVRDFHLDSRFDPFQIRAKIFAPTEVPNLFWSDDELHVSFDGPDPNAVNSRVVPGVGCDFQPAVLEGLAPGRLDIFWAGQGALWNTVWSGGSWETQFMMGDFTSIDTVEAVCGLNPGKVDLFWRSQEGDLRDAYFDGEKWQVDTIATGLPFHALPTAIYNAAENKIQVFWLDTGGVMQNTWSDGQSWTTEPISGGAQMQDPAVAYGYAPGRTDIFWGGADKNLKHTSGDGTTWNTSPLNLGPVNYTYPSSNPSDPWSNMFAQRISINPAPLASAPAAWSQSDPGQIEVCWGGLNGQAFYYRFDGNWQNTALPQSVTTRIRSTFQPDNWGLPPDESFWMKSPPAFCRFAGNDIIYWIDGANRLCETTRWNRQSNYSLPDQLYQPLSSTNPWSGDWKTTVVDFNPGNYYYHSQNPDGTFNTNVHFPGRPNTNFPAPWSSPRFAPVPLSGLDGTSDAFQLFICDLDFNLWSVVLRLTTDPQQPPHSAQNLHLGPLAFAPAAAVVPPVNNQGGGKFIFWCSAVDKSLKQSSLNTTTGMWETVTIDPGPMSSGPTQLLTPSGALHLFWADANGELRHKSVMGDAIGNGAAANGWSAGETGAFETMASAAFAVYDTQQQKIRVFWLKSTGALMQTTLIESAPPASRWQTTNIYSVTLPTSGKYHANVGAA
ncbi:MAG TPA: hypothetical protein VLL54_04645 [Pyrinomonadaceae bacterium]|nr:hypothetical protein [Pyrinomonadaceae bacterium]